MGAHKLCPRCRQPAPLDMPVCRSCGHAFRTQFAPSDRTQMIPAQPEPTQMIAPQPAWSAPPERWMDTPMPIILMWALAALSLFGTPIGGGVFALAAGVAALGLAIACVCTRRLAHRVNGWIFIGLSIAYMFMITMVIAVLMASGRAPTPDTRQDARPTTWPTESVW